MTVYLLEGGYHDCYPIAIYADIGEAYAAAWHAYQTSDDDVTVWAIAVGGGEPKQLETFSTHCLDHETVAVHGGVRGTRYYINRRLSSFEEGGRLVVDTGARDADGLRVFA